MSSASSSAVAASAGAGSKAAAPSAAVPSTPAFDLTQTLAASLDKHMVLPLLDFLGEKNLYKREDLLQGKIQLAAATKMVDFHAGEYRALHGKDPADVEAHKAAVYAELQAAQAAVGPLLAILNDDNHLAEELIKEERFTNEELATKHQVTRANIDALYVFARLNFDCGRYRDSADYLYYFRLLCRASVVEEAEASYQALWGKLASEILMVNGDAAHADLLALKELIDSRTHVPPYLQLQQRAWLVTWSLFVFFNIPDGRVKMIEFFMADSKLLNAVQTSAPHLLRYLTAAVLINRKQLRSTNYSKNILKDLSKILSAEQSNYSDPTTQFLLAVYSEFDFHKAHLALRACDTLLQNDFFLGYSADEFMESARLLLFEAYTKIHKVIKIDTLATVLDLASPSVFPSAEYKERKQALEAYNAEVSAATSAGQPAPPMPAALATPLPTPEQQGLSAEAVVEAKLVHLIRVCRVDARIDARAQQIVLHSEHAPSLYQQIIDKTKSIAYRSTQLVHVVDKKVATRNQEQEAANE